MSQLTSENTVDFANESYPTYGGRIEDNYLPEYEPMSLNAPHSSLERSSTWIGFGLWICGVGFTGIFIMGLAQVIFGSRSLQIDPAYSLTIGAVGALVMFIVGYFLIRHGRKGYKAYRKRTGRSN